MKFASLRSQGRDGRLAAVSSDLKKCLDVTARSGTLQFALDAWDCHAPRLAEHCDCADPGEWLEFNEAEALSPLPRAYQWADGSAYLNHMELVRRARGAEMPDSFRVDPLMYQGGSDSFLAPRDPVAFASEDWGIDFEAEVAVVVTDVPMGTSAADAICLIMLANDITLRNLVPAELGKGFGFFQSKPSSSFSPVAVTPDELGEAWDGRKLHLPLCVDVNGQPFGRADAGTDMSFDFAELISHAAKTRPLAAGTIIGSGTVSNRCGDEPGRPISEGGVGYSCIAELRTI